MVTIAEIGAGKWGFNWVRALARIPNIEFRYCCDLMEASLERVRQQFPTVRTTSRLEDLLEDETLDAVVLATSAPTHYPMAKRLLEAGKHVMVEKPLTLATHEAEELTRLAQKRNRIIMVGHLLEYHPAILHIKEMIDDGELGDIHYLYSQRLNLGTIRRDENAWWSLAPHDISVACRLYGEEPISVQCRGQCVVQDDTADVVFGTLAFQSGRLAHIHVSWLDPHKTRRLTLVGSKRMVSFDDTLPNYQVTVYDKGFKLNDRFESFSDWISMHQGDVVLPQVRSGEPLMQEAQHFIDCIKTGQRPVSDGVSGLRVVSVLECGQRSLEQQGMPMTIPEIDDKLFRAA